MARHAVADTLAATAALLPFAVAGWSAGLGMLSTFASKVLYVGFSAVGGVVGGIWGVVSAEFANPNATNGEKIYALLMGSVFGFVAPGASLGQAFGGVLGLGAGQAAGLTHQGLVSALNAGGLIGGVIGGALQAGVTGWFRSGGVNITVVAGGQGHQVGSTSRSIAMGILSGIGAAIFDAGCALLGGAMFEALGMDALEGANMGMALGAMAQTALQHASPRNAFGEVTSLGRNIEVVLGDGKRGSRSGGSLSSEHSIAFRDGAGTIHERRQSYERRAGGDEGASGTRGRETGVVNADEQCNLFVFRTELDGSSSMLKACYGAGTPIVLDEAGTSKMIEDIQPGDFVLSCDENDPTAKPERKRVLQKFERTGKILTIKARDRIINTTPEHPHWVKNKNAWVIAGQLEPGDIFRSHDGQWVTCEEVLDTGRYEKVYNFSVEDFHTFFVGGSEWGWSVWAHNAYGRQLKATDKPGTLARAAFDFRQQHNKAGSNKSHYAFDVAVVRYRSASGQIKTRAFRSGTEKANGKVGMSYGGKNHSEQRMIRWLHKNGYTSKDVLSVYTERSPCSASKTNCTSAFCAFGIKSNRVFYAVPNGSSRAEVRDIYKDFK